jgi:predicted alpha/beta-fold hydrolase
VRESLTTAAKTDDMMRGLRAISGYSFRPSWLSCRCLCGGNGQTLMTAFKDACMKLARPYVYDRQEEFTLSDGGQITISYRGEFAADSRRPVLFMLPSNENHAQRGHSRITLDYMYRGGESGKGFDVVFIGYRGTGDDSKGEFQSCKTPCLYTGNSPRDFIEPMRHLYNKLCRPHGKKAFALGMSNGAINLVNASPELDFITAAVTLWVIFDYRQWLVHLKRSCCGLYDWSIGNSFAGAAERNINIIAPHMQEKHGIDVVSRLRELREQK